MEAVPYDRERFFKVGMQMGSFEELLRCVIKTQNVRRVLDVRLRTEHNTMALAEHLPLGGKLVVLGYDPDLHLQKQKYHAASPHGAKIQIRLGRPTHAIPEMMDKGEQYDLILLDAVNHETTSQIKIAFESGLLNKHGTIIVENAFEGGAGYRPYTHPSATHLLGEYMANEPTLHKVLLPMPGAVMVLRRLKDMEERAAAMGNKEPDWITQLHYDSYNY